MCRTSSGLAGAARGELEQPGGWRGWPCYEERAGSIQPPPSGTGPWLEEEMATHSSVLAWIISWTEAPDRLQSMGSQRVRHS